MDQDKNNPKIEFSPQSVAPHEPVAPTNVQQANDSNKKLYRIGWWVRLIGIVCFGFAVVNPYNLISALRLQPVAIVLIVLPLIAFIVGQVLYIKNKPVELKLEEYSRKNWRMTFIVLGAFNFFTIIGPVALLAAVANSPASIIAIVIIPILFVGVLVLFANVVVLTTYMFRGHSGVKGKVISAILLLISLVLLLFPGFLLIKNNILWYVNPEDQIEKIRQEDRVDEQNDRESRSDSLSQYDTTLQEAKNAISGCKADYVIGYTDISKVGEYSTKLWLEIAEKSESGVVLLENSPKTYVFASKENTTEFATYARNYRDECYKARTMYVQIDDWIETQYPVGQWTRVDL